MLITSAFKQYNPFLTQETIVAETLYGVLAKRRPEIPFKVSNYKRLPLELFPMSRDMKRRKLLRTQFEKWETIC